LAYVTGHKPRGSSGERRARPGHVPAPDPYLCHGLSRPGTLLTLGPYSEWDWVPPKGSDVPSWGPWTCTYRGPVSSCGGPDPTMSTGMHYLSLPRGDLGPAHVAWLGAILRVALRYCTGAASSCCRRGYP
jgi:hypothetical protein